MNLFACIHKSGINLSSAKLTSWGRQINPLLRFCLKTQRLNNKMALDVYDGHRKWYLLLQNIDCYNEKI